ncbi:MuDRA-like transposase [Cucumis melo var. makuwa]|uniref:MuDRA-like transposase n=1 Tax=Cucumis melo var. makuwa TaxID=1194695 RepID=A0A5A7SQ41_CUCMM|nr:MuDRA-like transposase [Cucumis melo var. makuwa]
MIGTNSAIWESYESYHSKDDTFTWESVEMYNELFDIPEQRDAPTKDCKGKGKVDYSSSSRKLKTKGSGWSEESSTSEELDFVVKKTTKEVLFVRCIDNKCGWRLRAQAKSWVVRELIKSKFKGPGRIYKSRDIIKDMRQDYGINMSYEKAWRTRENAYERVRGSPEESYNLLRRYGEALKFTNPDTIFHMELEDDRFFKYLFMAVGACVREFLNCIRPVIVMDGTFLKNKYRGQLIVAVCLDGNNQIYPLAFGIVDRETDDSIQWFLEKLKGAIGEVPNLGFVTDRKTCFAKGISSDFPSAFHGLCVQHLSQNLHDKYKNDTIATLFYNASRTYRESTFVEAWRHLLAFPNGSGKYLNDIGIARWSRVHCPERRYNMMTTNIAESMNSILKEPRDLPIASFLENVRALLQRWFWERREEGIKVTSTLTKWAELVIQKKQEGALTMKVNPIDCYQFHVKNLDKEEVVNLQTKECTCKEFQAEKLPCSHVIAAARDRNINVYSLYANYYTNECLLAAYAEAVYPVGNQSDWKTSEDYVHMTVLPPKVVKRVGRPKKKRIPSVGEAPKLHKCGRCKQVGWGDVNYVISCINIKEHWLAIAADMRKCKIYVFDSMPNYVEQKLVDEALQMPARCIPSLAIAIGVNLHSDHFTYGPWPICRSKVTLQKGRSLDCGIFCSKFVECLVTGSDLGCLTVPNMKLFRQQYVLELWANKYFC